MTNFIVIPISLKQANNFVEIHHRHNGRTAVDGGKFAIAASYKNQGIVGVAIAGRPLSRVLDISFPLDFKITKSELKQGFSPNDELLTLEVTRCCTIPDAPKNTCSFLYGACWKIARAMGYGRLITYTLATESGSSLKGAGWECVAESKPHKQGWARKNQGHINRKTDPIYQQLKLRWEISI